MIADLPAWVPSGPGTSPALPELEGRGGRVVVLLSSEGALSGGWSGAVALDLVESWGNVGARVVLADAGLSTPVLHEALGIPNHEGLVDAVRWGVSVQRVIRRPEGRRFLALTAGTAVADTAGVLALPRWHALCTGFREAGVTMAVLVPVWEEALPAVLGEADGIVILAEPEEDLGELVDGWTVPVFAVTGPAPSAGVESDLGAPSAALDEAAPAEDGAAEEPGFEEMATEEPPLGEMAAEEPLFEDVVAHEPLSEDVPLEFAEAGASMSEAAPVEDAVTEAGAEMAPTGEEASFDLPEVVSMDGEEWGEALSPTGTDEDEVPLFPAPEFEDATEPELLELSAEAVSEESGGAAPTLGEAATLPVSEAAPGVTDFVLPEPIPVPPSFEDIVGDSEPPARRSRAGMLLLLLLVIVAAAVVAAWFGYVEIPGITPNNGSASSAPAPPVVEAPPVTETSPLQAYSLALEAYRDGLVASQRVADLRAAVPDVLFQSVPVEVDGTLFHRVLAGPATDSAAVLALSARIAEAASLDPSSWVARWTPLAFQLGEISDREAAERRVEVLADLGVPGYVLAADYSDGSTRYRVYVGAFQDSAGASYLSGLLQERGLSSATLSERTGRLPE